MTCKGRSAKRYAGIGVWWNMACARRAERHKDVIVLSICRDRVGVESGRHVFDPAVGDGVDHPKHRPTRIVPSCHIKAAISLVEPHLVGAAYLGNVCQDI